MSSIELRQRADEARQERNRELRERVASAIEGLYFYAI
jgi:hypothetical protein